MASYESVYTAKGFSILKRCELPAAPANPRERAEALGKAFGVAPEQCVKALAMQFKTTGAPFVLLLPTPERLDTKLLSRLLGQDADYYPQEKIETDFGAPMNAVSPFAASEKKLQVVADGRVFDAENIAAASGDPLIETLVAADDLKAFLGDALRVLDFESAKKSGGNVIEPRTLKGFRDYLPEDMLPRQAMIAAITRVFERFGFAPLQTPALEYTDILLGKLGGDAEKLLFRFRDNGGRDVCLRYDLTVPLARVAAQYADLPKPFKRYQVAPVWRAENPGRGRFREFFQCDCDIVGSASLIYDAECIALDFAVMKELGVNAEVRFNNRKVLSALGQKLAVSDERQMMAIFRTIDKLPSQGKTRVRELLVSDAKCSAEQIETIMKFVEIAGDFDAMMAQFSALVGGAGDEAVAELRAVKGFVDAMTSRSGGTLAAERSDISASTAAGVPPLLLLDFSIARGLDYYTGTVYETFLTDLPGYGSVMSGGRYDKLIERYSGKPTPAVGISVGIDRLFAGLVELKKVKASAATSRACVVPMDAACVSAALAALGALRSAGVAAEMLLDNEKKPKIDKQLSAAGKKGIPYALILGGNEIAKGTVMLKDLNAKAQEEMTLARAIEKLKVL
ncbi:MAG TPA: histidine--tRNA ligase [Planctomycetota bacterium]|nr:histidine--tRNA ligase [Planctomycetota bacterium]